MVAEYKGQGVRVRVDPDANGIVSVNHGLRAGAGDLLVRCFNGEGLPVGYLAAIDVSDSVVEVATIPHSGVVEIEITPLTAGEGG